MDDGTAETIVRDADDSRAVSEVVVETVAIATDTDPVDLRPLHRSVDADALNAAFDTARRDSGLEVAFETNGCRVTVRRHDDDLRVIVRPTDDPDGGPDR